jgi:putative PIN family toxin of toxin-antitoxin system
MRVLLDTNILARSAGPLPGLARELVRNVTHHRHHLLLSPFLVAELGRVLRYERVRRLHGFNDAEIDQFIADIVLVAVMVNPEMLLSIPHLSDADDASVIAAAITGRVEVLCTLDRHLRQSKIRDYCHGYGIEVLSDVELMSRLRE